MVRKKLVVLKFVADILVAFFQRTAQHKILSEIDYFAVIAYLLGFNAGPLGIGDLDRKIWGLLLPFTLASIIGKFQRQIVEVSGEARVQLNVLRVVVDGQVDKIEVHDFLVDEDQSQFQFPSLSLNKLDIHPPQYVLAFVILIANCPHFGLVHVCKILFIFILFPKNRLLFHQFPSLYEIVRIV